MSFTKPSIVGQSSAKRPGAAYGFVVGAGASDPDSFGGFVAAAVRLETAGAVPFLRVTMDAPAPLDKFAILPSVRGDTFAHAQVTSLVATVGGAADDTVQFDVRYFDAAGLDVEPVDGARLDLVLVGDLSAS